MKYENDIALKLIQEAEYTIGKGTNLVQAYRESFGSENGLGLKLKEKLDPLVSIFNDLSSVGKAEHSELKKEESIFEEFKPKLQHKPSPKDWFLRPIIAKFLYIEKNIAQIFKFVILPRVHVVQLKGKIDVLEHFEVAILTVNQYNQYALDSVLFWADNIHSYYLLAFQKIQSHLIRKKVA
eukprot:TRINITY_DN4000_c0_g3_i2.p1 TRINITY_DN4000_c0_g3~~TRINITY_DN4000_c0_g3_i2.p1  ORF type:complete len:181 (-),score=25.72 TRINITY_DN4000_c0_g3_i2:164-706(-)